MEIKNKQLRRLIAADTEYDEDGEPVQITENDLDNSEFNPANDAYIGMTRRLQRRMVSISHKMRPSHVTAAKLADQGMKNTHIALRLRVDPQTVGRVLRRDDVIELRKVMNLYTGLLTGATQAMRDAMLYRIAVRNEIIDPKVSISAIAEANKLVHQDRVHKLNQKTGGNSKQTVVVQIGDARLKPSNLDTLPPKHIIKDVNKL